MKEGKKEEKVKKEMRKRMCERLIPTKTLYCHQDRARLWGTPSWDLKPYFKELINFCAKTIFFL